MTVLIYLFLLHWVFVASRGPLFVAVCGLLIAVASLVEEHGSKSMWASVVVARGLSNCSTRALECRLSS